MSGPTIGSLTCPRRPTPSFEPCNSMCISGRRLPGADFWPRCDASLLSDMHQDSSTGNTFRHLVRGRAPDGSRKNPESAEVLFSISIFPRRRHSSHSCTGFIGVSPPMKATSEWLLRPGNSGKGY
jgi:hypothetical protein